MPRGGAKRSGAGRGGGHLTRPGGGLDDATAGGWAARPSATVRCGAGPGAPASGGNGATCLTHCDGSDTKAEVPLIMSSIKSFSEHAECGRLEVHLVGGFSDDRQLSQKLTHQLLKLNDREENENHFPIIYGIAVNIKTAEIYRASFQDRGPEEQLRAARALAGGPSLSTSPLAEPPHFVEHIRSTLMFLKKFPSPENILFPGNKALLYKKNKDGLWEKISSPGS
ncbi:protein N-terminal asparagine amidohydrolase isoform 13 [Mus musculus]|uniref:protein N-terminal asparagine amidohydrolase isoform 13 n=1 Tax=Mus musculus TaxID=10090 RepID=UPI0011AE908E|nr:protein N-terminal asparagine amidohydrolase isoform 13 [Mus musculus]